MIKSSFMVLLFTFLFNCPSLSSESVADRCARISRDSATFKTCVFENTRQETQALKGSACSQKSCIYSIQCKTYNKNTDFYCSNSDFTVTFKSEANGNAIIIKDKSSHMTEYFQCGTCSYLEYVSGPLKNAEIRKSSDNNIILQVPNRKN